MSTAARPATKAPISGRKAPKNVRIISGTTSGTPMTSSARPISSASTSADERDAADVAAERGVDARADLVPRVAAARADEVDHPAPHRRPVLEEEERQQDGEDQPGDDLAEQDGAGLQRRG